MEGPLCIRSCLSATASRDGKQSFSGKMRQIAAKQCRVKPLLHPFYYRFTTIDFSLQKHIVHNAANRGKSKLFMPSLQIMFVCYPGMCRVRMVKKHRNPANKDEKTASTSLFRCSFSAVVQYLPFLRNLRIIIVEGYIPTAFHT